MEPHNPLSTPRFDPYLHILDVLDNFTEARAGLDLIMRHERDPDALEEIDSLIDAGIDWLNGAIEALELAQFNREKHTL